MAALISQLPPANITQSLYPHLLTSASSPLRLDARAPLDPLTASVDYSSSRRGVTSLSLSSPSTPRVKTTIQTSISASLVAPRPDRPYEGIVSINVHSAMGFATSSASRSNAISEAAVAELERQLELALRRSNLLDREALCLKAGQLVWNITLTIHLQSVSCGNLLEACVLASWLSLRDFKKREAIVEEEGEATVFEDSERVPVGLPLTGGLVAVEVAVFVPPVSTSTVLPNKSDMDQDDGPTRSTDPIYLVSPTPQEVLLSSCLLTFVLTPNTGQFLLSEKIGRTPISYDVVLRGMELAEKRAKETGKWVENRAKERDQEVGAEIR